MGFEAGDANLYRYVGNSPTNGTDPAGLTVFIGGYSDSQGKKKYRDERGTVVQAVHLTTESEQINQDRNLDGQPEIFGGNGDRAISKMTKIVRDRIMKEVKNEPGVKGAIEKAEDQVKKVVPMWIGNRILPPRDAYDLDPIQTGELPPDAGGPPTPPINKPPHRRNPLPDKIEVDPGSRRAGFIWNW